MWSKICLFSIYAILYGIVQYNVTHAKRILVIANYPSYSHQIVYRNLCLELNKQGYEIVSVTTDPIKNSSLTNYREIDLKYFYKGFPEFKKIIPFKNFFEAFLQLNLLDVEESILWTAAHIVNREVFKNPEMKKLYATDSNEHFDAVIVAQGPTQISLNAFAYRFNAPLIGISSLDVYNHMRYTFGSLILPSHISNWQANTLPENNMSFWRRLVNFYEVWKQMYKWANVHTPIEDAIVKEYLGEDLPHIDDITRNMSIYLVNKHPVLSYARPEQPNVIFYHGFHIAKVPPALPKDLKQFLDDATKGFIYVSLGTNVNWQHLPNNTFKFFLEVFSALPYKVVWKYDPDLLPGKFENILASKWFPQQSILAHRNIKLFIYQGGIQSTEETVHYGVPVIGFPIFWDQMYNVQYITIKLGVGVHLHSNNISKESIETAVHEVINNKRYKDRIKYVSKLYNDVPYDSLQNAVRWIEYVIRQNGTPFLRNSLCDETWYRRYDWDIIGIFAILIFVTSLLILWALLQILRFHLRMLSNSLR
ncbi:UDP-glucuronosyltransferase 2B2-like [Camponotus japonicus]